MRTVLRSLAIIPILSALATLVSAQTPGSLAWAIPFDQGNPGQASSFIQFSPGNAFTVANTFGTPPNTQADIFNGSKFGGNLVESPITGLTTVVGAGTNVPVYGPWAVGTDHEGFLSIRLGTSNIYGAGGAAPLAAIYAANLGQPGVLAVGAYADGSTTELQAFLLNTINSFPLSDPDIDPEEAAITPNGDIIAVGKDNLSTATKGGQRLCIYNSSFTRVYTETEANPTILSGTRYSYVIAASPTDDNVYFARNTTSTIEGGYEITQINAAVPSFTSVSGTGTVSQVASYGSGHPVYAIVDVRSFGLNPSQLDVNAYASGTLDALWSKPVSPIQIAADDTGVTAGNDNANSSGVQILNFTNFDEAGVQQWTQSYASPNGTSMTLLGMAADFPSVYATAEDATGPTAVCLMLTQQTAVTTLALSAPSVIGGNPGSGTITLNSAAPDGFPESLTSSSQDSTVPSQVFFSSGETQLGFDFSTVGVDAPETVAITASDSSGAFRTTSVTLEPATAASFIPNVKEFLGGEPVRATLTLNGETGPSGTTVTFTGTGPVVIPTPLDIPKFTSAVKTVIHTDPVDSVTTATLTAHVNGTTAQATITLTPAVPSTLTFSPASVVGGGPVEAEAELKLTGPAGAQDTATVTTSTADAVVPGTVPITAGANNVSFAVQTKAVAFNTAADIKVTVGGASLTAMFTILAPISDFGVSPNPVVGGQYSSAVVQVPLAAGASGIVVGIASSSSAAVVPKSVTIAKGTTAVSFPFATRPVSSSTVVTITATLGGISRFATLTVIPAISSFTLDPASVVGGTNSDGVVHIPMAAVAGGVTATIKSSSADVTVPSSVTIAAGASAASFPIKTKAVTAATAVTITVTLNGSVASQKLTLMP